MFFGMSGPPEYAKQLPFGRFDRFGDIVLHTCEVQVVNDQGARSSELGSS